ncbi:hypothetical protein GW17_00012006 [Ensete ventricosum]|nr:hypothetical protein GW17_00012006 [Ensete ventricosum]
MDITNSGRLHTKDNGPLQTEVPTSAYKTHSYLQAKVGHNPNQTRAAKPTASPLLVVQEYLTHAPFSPARHSRPRAVLARTPSPPAGRPRAIACTRARFFSRVSRQSVSPHGENDRDDAAMGVGDPRGTACRRTTGEGEDRR